MLIVPPGTDPLTELAARGQVRLARRPLSSLRSIERRGSTQRSEEIVANVRDSR